MLQVVEERNTLKKEYKELKEDYIELEHIIDKQEEIISNQESIIKKNAFKINELELLLLSNIENIKTKEKN